MVAAHVTLDHGGVHILVGSDQVENVRLVVFSSPEALQSYRCIDPLLHHLAEV